MATPTIEYRTVDKSGWGPGAWQGEPDKRQWQDPVTGLPCLIVRGPSGALCGYVGVAPDHPAHGLNYDHWTWDAETNERLSLTPIKEAINGIQVHGGLTFASGCGHGDDPSRGICHIPGDGEPDHVWWFGFDCAHCNDVTPAYERTFRWSDDERYRDQAYVEREIASLAAQLAAMGELAVAPKASPPSSEGASSREHS